MEYRQWNNVNEEYACISFIKPNGMFLANPHVANYFNNFFIYKVNNLRQKVLILSRTHW